jgi:hypothetical protein
MGFFPRDPAVGKLQSAPSASATDRAFVAHYVCTPGTVDPDGILDGQATSASVVTTVTEFLAQPDVPSVITVLPGGTTADVPAGDVTITGTDIGDNVISEAVTFAANASAAQESTYAFKTVTSIAFPVQDGASATYDVGWGKRLVAAQAAALDLDSGPLRQRGGHRHHHG